MDSQNTNSQMTEKPQKLVAPVYLANGHSSCFVIPKRLAIKYKLDRPSHVTIEDIGTGIFIKKLDL